jgi:hypothetical protein
LCSAGLVGVGLADGLGRLQREVMPRRDELRQPRPAPPPGCVWDGKRASANRTRQALSWRSSEQTI